MCSNLSLRWRRQFVNFEWARVLRLKNSRLLIMLKFITKTKNLYVNILKVFIIFKHAMKNIIALLSIWNWYDCDICRSCLNGYYHLRHLCPLGIFQWAEDWSVKAELVKTLAGSPIVSFSRQITPSVPSHPQAAIAETVSSSFALPYKMGRYLITSCKIIILVLFVMVFTN